MKLKMIIAMTLVSILLVACGGNDTSDESTDLNVEDMKELVQGYTTGDVQAESASITSTELIITEDDNQETVYDLPDDEFFVSIAPFVSETHPCDIHSLTGCQGELVEEEFDLHIEDEVGNVVIDETKKSEANGFIDVWLPRDKTYNVTISSDGKTTESEISTFEGDNTCITTMQLS